MTPTRRRPERHPRAFRHALVTIAASLALATGASFPAAAFDAEATKLYENAAARLEKDDVAGAIIQLNSALQKDPSMLAAHVLMGKARLRNGDPENAEKSFDSALRLGVDKAELALPMAQAYYGQGKFDELVERISTTGLPREAQIEILIMRGNAQAERRQPDTAMRTFEEARALDPKSIAVRLAQATVLLRAGQIGPASAAAEEIVKMAPNDSAAWNLRASVAHIKGDLPAALADYAKAIALNSGNMDARVAQAGILLDLGRLDDADRAVAELARISPREPRGTYLRAVVASRKKDPDTERKALTDTVALLDPVPKKVLSRYGQLLLLGGLAHYGLGNMEKAADYLSLYVRLNPKLPGPSKLLASIYIDRRTPAPAIELLEPLQAAAPNDPQLMSLLAAAYMAEKKFSQATPLLERALKASGGAPEVRTDFGVSLVASGQGDLGLAQLQQAFAKDPGQAHAGVVLATMYLNRGQPKKALEVIDAVVKRDPKNVNAINLQGIVRVAAGDRAGGRAAYESVLVLDPRYQGARLNLVRLDLADGNPDAARRRLAEMVKSAPNNTDAMIEYSRLEEMTGHPAEAVAWLEKARAVPAMRLRAGIQLVDLLLRQRDPARALAVAKDVVSREPKDYSALRTLARAELAAGDSRSARQTLSNLGPLAGFDSDKNADIARLQFAAGDREGAAYSLDKVLKGNADHLPALTLATEMAIAAGDYGKAEQQAKRIAERFPAKAVGLRLQGDIASARNQPAAAIASYRAALGKEKSTDTALRLYRAYAKSGDPAKGLAFLDQWCRENPADGAALRVLADGRLRGGDLAAARTAYEELLKRDPNGVEVLNNLAQVAIRQGDKIAVDYAERAFKFAGNEAAILDTLGWALIRNGQMDRGIGLLRDARLRDASNSDIRFHLAAGLAQAGREAEARAELKEILKDGSSFDEIEEARKLQKKLGP